VRHVSLHSLRHLAVSRWISAGASPKVSPEAAFAYAAAWMVLALGFFLRLRAAP
jgi:hypothetical protein